MSFLHGVRIKEVEKGIRPILTPPTCIIALVGTAPVHQVDPANATVNRPVLVQTDLGASANFGPELAGYTIPAALEAILAYGTAQVVVLNVFDPTTHKVAVPAEAVTLGTDGTVTLAHPDIITATVKNQAGTTTYVSGTDYTLDRVTAKLTRLASGTIAAGASLKVDYDYANPSLVEADDVIGTTTVAGLRTGLMALLDIPGRFGIKPRIILVPGFCTQATVAAQMLSKAEQLKAHAYIDAPVGTTFQQAIEGRGAAGAINFTTSSQRGVLAFPHVKIGDQLEPLSQNLAGLASFVDLNEGYWVSLSNHELQRVTGLEIPVTWSFGDQNCEANLLNAVGVVTVARGAATGFRAWGNRSAAWPTDTHPLNFICVRAVADILEGAVEQAMLPFTDKPLNRATLDAVRETVNGYLTTLIQKGALVGGECTWDAADNPVDELALGHAAFKLSFMPPVPMELVEFTSEVDTAWLATLYNGATTA
jgi:phage tail sheath protein FI